MVNQAMSQGTSSSIAVLIFGTIISQAYPAPTWPRAPETKSMTLTPQVSPSASGSSITLRAANDKSAIVDGELIEAAQNFYTRLAANQQEVDEPLKRAIYDSLWNLYQE